MSDFASTIAHGRIGRFPVWLVGAALAAVVVLFVLWKNRVPKREKTAEQTTDTADFVSDPNASLGVDGLPPGAIGDYLNANPTDPSYPVGLSPRGIPGPITNVQWARLVGDWLIGQGMDPALVERSLAKYIQGLSLTPQERAIIDQGQVAFGLPPEGLILSNTPEPEPVPTPGGSTTPPIVRTPTRRIPVMTPPTSPVVSVPTRRR